MRRLALLALLSAALAFTPKSFAQSLYNQPGGQSPVFNTLRSGIGAPSNLIGNNGDFYIDATASAQMLYGPKAANAWGTGVSIQGGAGLGALSGAVSCPGGVCTERDISSVKDNGAVGNGIADDSTAIATTVNALHFLGGGMVYLPPGTYLTGTLPIYSNVHYLGAGEEATIVKLKAGANSDVFQGTVSGYVNGVNGYSGANALTNLAAPALTGSSVGVNSFSIRRLTIDGNMANQSGYGACIHVYGYGYRLEDLFIRNCYGDGIYQDWNPPTKVFSLAPNQLEVQLHNVKIHDIAYGQTNSTGMGIRWGGPTDSQWSNLIVYKTGSHGVQTGPNAAALQANQIHIWGMANSNQAVGWLNEANGVLCSNCEVEGSDVLQVANFASQLNWIGGKIFSGGAPGSSHGIQLGQLAGDTPYVGSVNQSTPGSLANPATAAAGTLIGSVSNKIYGYFENTSAGALYPRSENSNDIQILGNQTNSTAMLLVDGLLSGTDNYLMKSHGITSTHLNATVGGVQIAGDASRIFTVTDLSGHDIFNFNGSSRPFGAGIAQYPGTNAGGFRDWFYTLPSWNITHDGFIQSVTSGFAVGSNTTNATGNIPAPWVLGNNATVVVYNSGTPPANTPNPTAAFPYGKVRLTAAGNVTGLILQACNVDGTEVTLFNESAFSMTFASSSATSNVSVPSWALAAGTARKLMCNQPPLWYPLSGS